MVAQLAIHKSSPTSQRNSFVCQKKNRLAQITLALLQRNKVSLNVRKPELVELAYLLSVMHQPVNINLWVRNCVPDNIVYFVPTFDVSVLHCLSHYVAQWIINVLYHAAYHIQATRHRLQPCHGYVCVLCLLIEVFRISSQLVHLVHEVRVVYHLPKLFVLVNFIFQARKHRNHRLHTLRILYQVLHKGVLEQVCLASLCRLRHPMLFGAETHNCAIFEPKLLETFLVVYKHSVVECENLIVLLYFGHLLYHELQIRELHLSVCKQVPHTQFVFYFHVYLHRLQGAPVCFLYIFDWCL
eukprot:jgi/Antlo1/1499/188